MVRRLVGYERLEWPALAALERIHDLAGDYINFLHPVRKLVSKTRSGPRVTRRYDVASTPFHRLLDSGVLSMTMTRQLQKRSQHSTASIPTDSKFSSNTHSGPWPPVPFGRTLK